MKGRRYARWRQVYLLVIVFFAALVAEAQMTLSEREHQWLLIALVLIFFWLLTRWVAENAAVLDREYVERHPLVWFEEPTGADAAAFSSPSVMVEPARRPVLRADGKAVH